MANEASPVNFDGRFRVDGMPGVAFWLKGYAKLMTEESWELACDITEHGHEHDEGCYLYSEPEAIDDPGMVIAVMVGDDREHIVEVADLTEIDRDDYCGQCGQIGCTHDGR